MKHSRFSPMHLRQLAVALLAGLVLPMMVLSNVTLSAGSISSADSLGGSAGFGYEPNGATPVESSRIDIRDAESHTGAALPLSAPITNVTGLVHDPGGVPLPGAGVAIFHDNYWDETSTDTSGAFFFYDLPPGEFWLHAAPPWKVQGLIAGEPFTITIPTSITLVDAGVITLPYAYKTVTGQVLNAETSAAVTDAMVWAHRLDGPGYADAPTDGSGEFNLSLTGGEWHLALEPLNPPVEWIFPGPPAWVVFEQNTTPQTETVTLEVIPTNAWVTGRVVCPGGGLCLPGDLPPEAIWVELGNDGIGNDAGLAPDYRFGIPIPDGWYELLAHVDHPELQGPEPLPVFVGPGQTLDVGDIQLLLKDARIEGRVSDEFGAGVVGVPVIGWQPEGAGWGWAETDASGDYSMPVIGGEWFVEAQPGPELPYVLRQPPPLVFVAPGGTVSGVDFALTNAEAQIKGIAADANSYEPLWGLDGGAWAEQYVGPPDEFAFFSDAPMRDGGFELKVKGGEQYNVGLEVPPHAPYVSGGAPAGSVAPGGLTFVEVPLQPKDAVVEGQLIDALTGLPPTEPIWAEVFGEDEQGHWVVAGVDPDSAWHELGVISGTWHLRAWVDPGSGYAATPTTTLVTVQTGQVVNQNFEVWPINALISGQTQKPDGAPLPGAFVFAEGESPFVGYFTTQTWSDEFGNFELLAPEGGYLVGAALPGVELEAMDWLNPAPLDVPWVSTAGPATGLTLRFRPLDGEIHGTVTFAPGLSVTPAHPAYVWGWADSGEWAETEAVVSGPNTFSYTLRVVSDTVWHIGAVYEDWNNGVFYESPEAVTPVPAPGGQAIQDLKLGGPWSLPQPIIVSFDGALMQTISLPNGVELSIPPGALVVSGTVTLYIFPTQELRPEPGHNLVGFGYELWATDQNGSEITQFNKNIMITFPYPSDPELAQQGISEYQLVPVYYSTLVRHWILADSYVVDTINNKITLQINHFTKFGLASTEKQSQIYLPIVFKNGP